MSSEIDPNQDVVSRLDKIEFKLNRLLPSGALSPAETADSLVMHRTDEEIDLRELWGVVWGGRWLIILTTFVFAVGSVLYALSLPDIYRSEALLVPAGDGSGVGTVGVPGGLGGLASLAGIDLNSGGGSKTTLAIEVLKSRQFISEFIAKHNLLVPLMASEGWDRSKNKLLINPDVYDVDGWVAGEGPSEQMAYRFFSGNLSVTQDKVTGFVRMGFEFYSPSLAKKIVDLLVEEINIDIKSREVQEAQKSINYLTGQLLETSLASMQKIFYDLIEEQTKTVMFAEVRREYVFKTVDEAVVPELKTKPKKSLICMLGVMLGAGFSIVFVVMRYFLFTGK